MDNAASAFGKLVLWLCRAAKLEALCGLGFANFHGRTSPLDMQEYYEGFGLLPDGVARVWKEVSAHAPLSS